MLGTGATAGSHSKRASGSRAWHTSRLLPRKQWGKNRDCKPLKLVAGLVACGCQPVLRSLRAELDGAPRLKALLNVQYPDATTLRLVTGNATRTRYEVEMTTRVPHLFMHYAALG